MGNVVKRPGFNAWKDAFGRHGKRGSLTKYKVWYEAMEPMGIQKLANRADVNVNVVTQVIKDRQLFHRMDGGKVVRKEAEE